ncbi:MAG: sulfatase-like hydrolase/transferase, partial [Candidatus Hydrogenedentes bacterium]|nr:sulfatase-like hydrolase/transferase [Candidatus Hydrogenedentota bacterium]
LAESLQSAGYTTWAFQTNANLTAALGFAQGFAPEDYHFSGGASASQVTEAALNALPEFGAPFFAYAHYMEPHAPYWPGPQYADALGEHPSLSDYDHALLSDDVRFMAYYMDQAKTALGLQDGPTVPDLSAAGKAAVEHRYALECFAMDQAIEKLVGGIQQRHPNTLFVFLSDHGEEFWERDGMGHGTTLHQEQVHVPFILVGPHIPQVSIDDTVSTLDLFPTLLALLELPAVACDGVDLGAGPGPRPVYSFSQGPWPALKVNTRAVFFDGYSYLLDCRRDSSSLFHIPGDALERNDLRTEKLEVAARLADLLSAHLRAFEGSLSQDGVPLDDAARETLEALGYVDGL